MAAPASTSAGLDPLNRNVLLPVGPSTRKRCARAGLSRPVIISYNSRVPAKSSPRRARASRAVLHQSRQPRLRADQPARNGQGRAVRAVLTIGEDAAAAVSRRVRGQGRRTTSAACRPIDRRRGDRARRKALRTCVQRLRRRLGRATRRRAHRLRVRLERADESARVGTADGLPRAVHPIRALHRQAPRPMALPRARRRSSRERCAIGTCATMDEAFETYAKWIPPMQAYFARRYPKSRRRFGGVHRAAIRAKALDTLRGMLPAATQSNVGIYRDRTGVRNAAAAHAGESAGRSPGVRGSRCSSELRKVIPAFLTRVDQPDRGGRWSEYLAAARTGMEASPPTFRRSSPRRATKSR